MRLDKELARKLKALVENGATNQQIAAEVGWDVSGIPALKAHLKRGSYDAIASTEIDAEVDNAIETKFGLERDLQRALRQNLAQLEAGLEIIDDGKERTVASGRIDITARDENGRIVVIELKAGEADKNAVAQVLSYMGDVEQQRDRVRGVVVAQSFARPAVSAARACGNVQLVGYSFQFKFQAVDC
jgi:hypothetical protein